MVTTGGDNEDAQSASGAAFDAGAHNAGGTPAAYRRSEIPVPIIPIGAQPMSENTINGALRRLGYGQTETTAHSFRAMAATLLNEMGVWNPDAIEKQLAHLDASAVRSTHTRGEYSDERVRMMQHWSDYLDQIRDGAKILRPEFGEAGEN